MKTYWLVSGILFITIFTINCCSNKEEVNLPQEKITNIEICEMHNKIISDFQDISTMKSQSNSQMDIYLDNTIPILISQLTKYNKYRYNTNIKLNEHKRVFDNILVTKSSTKINFKEYSLAFIKDMKKQKMISEYMFQELNNLSKSSLYLSNEKIIDYLHNEFARDSNSEYEKKQKDLIIKMAESSNNLWNNQNNLKSFMLEESSKVIIADAVGALYGSLLGPIGSIVYGAGFSLYQNEVL